MQQIRFGKALQFEITIPDHITESHWIPVFSLQVLVENAIKHNAFTIESPLFIKIEYSDNFIIVSNNIQQKIVAEASAGIGLANLDERYKILSGNGISVDKNDGTFSVSIKVFDDENCNYRG